VNKGGKQKRRNLIQVGSPILFIAVSIERRMVVDERLP